MSMREETRKEPAARRAGRTARHWALLTALMLATGLAGPAAAADSGPATADKLGAQAGSAPADQPAGPQVAPKTAEAGGKAAAGEDFVRVELDRFIEQEQRVARGPELAGRKLIRMAVPLSFEARLKRLPEERDLSYVYTALEVSGISPMPEVRHRMFIESAEGRIIPVYVEKGAAARLQSGLKLEQRARFLGYHVYTYAKGPAILVVNFRPLP